MWTAKQMNKEGVILLGFVVVIFLACYWTKKQDRFGTVRGVL